MSAARLDNRTRESTRGRIATLLRRGPRTVDDLASALGLTGNAVRGHLASLERDGVVRQAGARRGTGAGKPALLYELQPEAEREFSRAYPLVLGAAVEVLLEELPPDEARALLARIGQRLARVAGGRARGEPEERLRAAAAVLTSLGGEVEVIDDGGPTIRGYGCPLASAVAHHPQLCHAVETLVSEVAGQPMREACDHGPRPHCRFRTMPAA